MRSSIAFILSIILTLPNPVLAASMEEAFEFFKAEQDIVTASRRPQPARKAPATVYVVSAEDIKASGARTMWDALRAVPGVEVMSSRTAGGDVSIRGLNKALSNQTLVLVDGRTVLNGYFDFLVWESLPITMDEVDRIEVVEGPASALYGANAVSGVINIITKTPENIQGGAVRYTGGERNTHLFSALAGGAKGPWAGKLSAGRRGTGRYEEASHSASQTSTLHGQGLYHFSADTWISASGGLSDTQTNFTTGINGPTTLDGPTGFCRLDLSSHRTRLRAFWNHSRTIARDFASLQDPNLDYDTYDASLEQSVHLPMDNNLVVGASFRQNTMTSKIFAPGTQEQNLWAFFFENEWRPHPMWTLTGSGRLDQHPFTKTVFSPRGSLVFSPLQTQTFRFSAGTSFRNPTLLENYVNFAQRSSNPGPLPPNPPFTTRSVSILGNKDLSAESIQTFELGYSGRFGRWSPKLTGFNYRIRDIINTTTAKTISLIPPTHALGTSFTNRGELTAWGGEAHMDTAVTQELTAFVNYAYQNLYSDNGGQAIALAAPRNKVNGGARYNRGGFTANVWAHWVDETFWIADLASNYKRLSDYSLVNLNIQYRFSGRLKGLEIGVGAFNALGRDHYELLPYESNLFPGQNGELIRSRWTGTVAYHF